MQNITRTVTTYHVKAYDLAQSESGDMEVKLIAECMANRTSMSKGIARAALEAENNVKIQRGINITWKEVGSVTYGMPLDTFIANSAVVSSETEIFKPAPSETIA